MPELELTVTYDVHPTMPSYLYVCINDDCDIILTSKSACKCGNTQMQRRKVVPRGEGYDLVYEHNVEDTKEVAQ